MGGSLNKYIISWNKTMFWGFHFYYRTRWTPIPCIKQLIIYCFWFSPKAAWHHTCPHHDIWLYFNDIFLLGQLSFVWVWISPVLCVCVCVCVCMCVCMWVAFHCHSTQMTVAFIVHGLFYMFHECAY